jgi:hypothetical protein
MGPCVRESFDMREVWVFFLCGISRKNYFLSEDGIFGAWMRVDALLT